MTRRQVIARDHILAALVELCADDLSDMWTDFDRRFAAAVSRDRSGPHILQRAQRDAVSHWLDARRVSAACWLADRLCEALQMVAAPEHLTFEGVVEANFYFRSHEEDLLVVGRSGSAPLRSAWMEGFAPSIEECVKDPAQWRTRHDILRKAERLKPIHASPDTEARADFLRRAGEHFDAVARALGETEPPPRHRELERHARWLIRHRIKRESYAAIARAESTELDAVKKAVGRLRDLAEF